LLAYIARSIEAHGRSNILTEIMYNEAYERAQQLDAEFEKTGELRGRLHGVPVSLKDQIGYKGLDNPIGCTSDMGKPALEHSTLVKVLLEEGAVPFVKTSVPQTMLSFECGNPLFGATTNPYDSTRIPGGSSGGEAALLASDACPLGFGSDIGGSLRIPAAFSGCFGLKPCAGRFPGTGCVNPNQGFEAGKRERRGPASTC
jgi:amidase